MKVSQIFALCISERMDTPCMATQGAIDRLLEGAFRDRATMLGCMGNDTFTGVEFSDLLWCAWGRREREIKIATGHSRDWWDDLAKRMFR